MWLAQCAGAASARGVAALCNKGGRGACGVPSAANTERVVADCLASTYGADDAGREGLPRLYQQGTDMGTQPMASKLAAWARVTHGSAALGADSAMRAAGQHGIAVAGERPHLRHPPSVCLTRCIRHLYSSPAKNRWCHVVGPNIPALPSAGARTQPGCNGTWRDAQ
jgi:hypothetical protein